MKIINTFRKWQIEAFAIGRKERYFLIQAPGGSGKSFQIVALAQADILDTGNKQLILVPRNHIHHGFYDEEAIEMHLPGEVKAVRWTVQNNFCSLKKSESKTQKLKEFLLAGAKQLEKKGQLAAIATHTAMVAVWNSMTDQEKRKALRKISIRIDEAHHISNVFHEGDIERLGASHTEISKEATQLGSLVQYALENGGKTLKLHLATATFFRGDRRTILSKLFESKFSKFYLPWDEHFETLGIEKLNCEFVSYQDDPMPQLLDLVRSEPNERHLVIVPSLNRRFRQQDTISSLVKGLKATFSDDEILDLVTPDTQVKNKHRLHTQPEKFRVVVACRLFDEGTDWVPCTRLHNTDACENSLTLAVQRFYRPLRYHPDKKAVRIFSYLPQFRAEMTIEERRQVLSNRMNAILACVVTQGDIIPCRVPLLKVSKAQSPSKTTSLQELYGDQYPDILREMIERYETVENKKRYAEIDAILDDLIASFEFPQNVSRVDLKNALQRQLLRISRPKSFVLDRTSLSTDGIDAETIRKDGFDKVWQMHSHLPSVLFFTTDNIDANCTRQLMRIVRDIPSLEEIHKGIQAYFQRTGKRPTFHQADPIAELNRSARSVDKILRRQFATTLAKKVDSILGDKNDDLLKQTHDLIRMYWSRGIRIGNKFGDLPEIGMSSFALNGRLTWNYNTTLAKEVEKVLGPATTLLTIEKTREVVGDYLRRGIRLNRKFGVIPELQMSSYNLSDRLKRNFNINLSELVKEIASQEASDNVCKVGSKKNHPFAKQDILNL